MRRMQGVECGAGGRGDTLCYNDAGLVPSPMPMTYALTSRAPTVRADVSIFQ